MSENLSSPIESDISDINIEPNKPTEINFLVDTGKWIMKIKKTETGPQILFNTQEYPNALPDDFAIAVVKVLCTSGSIKSFLQECLSD